MYVLKSDLLKRVQAKELSKNLQAGKHDNRLRRCKETFALTIAKTYGTTTAVSESSHTAQGSPLCQLPHDLSLVWQSQFDG